MEALGEVEMNRLLRAFLLGLMFGSALTLVGAYWIYLGEVQ